MKSGLQICSEAQEKMWCVTGLTYQQACELIEELNATGVIESNITVGGIQIYSNGQQEQMFEICKKYKAVPQRGLTRMQESVILKGDYVRNTVNIAKRTARKVRAMARIARNKKRRITKRKSRRR